MKLNRYISVLLCAGAMAFTGCEEETGRVVYPYSCPELSGLTLSAEQQTVAGDSLFLSVDIADRQTPLSTLELTVSAGDEVLYSESIRTKGYEAHVDNHGIFLPFTAGTEDTDAVLTLTAINVEGSEKTVTKNIRIVRPDIPETIYLHYDGETVAMHRSADNPYEYVTEEGEYPMEFTGRISTSATLGESKLIWGYSETVNEAALAGAAEAGFSFNYQDWQIERVTFNTLTFSLGVIGTCQILTVNGTDLTLGAGFYSASVDFEQGAAVEVSGFENLEGAYNRDFFEYDAESGNLTFLRESGTWEVYYSVKYNYMWLARMDDVAPDAFWLVGHGFCAAPVWHDDYNFGGWDTEDVFRMAYAVKTAPGIYQTTIYLSNTHEWESFEIEIYSNREWGKDDGIELTEGSLLGDTTGIAISQSNGITSAEGFVPGYYQLTFDTSAGLAAVTLTVKRIGE